MDRFDDLIQCYLEGEKKSQKRDIEKAYRYLIDHTGGKTMMKKRQYREFKDTIQNELENPEFAIAYLK